MSTTVRHSLHTLLTLLLSLSSLLFSLASLRSCLSAALALARSLFYSLLDNGVLNTTPRTAKESSPVNRFALDRSSTDSLERLTGKPLRTGQGQHWSGGQSVQSLRAPVAVYNRLSRTRPCESGACLFLHIASRCPPATAAAAVGCCCRCPLLLHS